MEKSKFHGLVGISVIEVITGDSRSSGSGKSKDVRGAFKILQKIKTNHWSSNIYTMHIIFYEDHVALLFILNIIIISVFPTH